jgi:hypothetical protein
MVSLPPSLSLSLSLTLLTGAPAYIGEMSPPSIRGILISLKEAAIVLGILLGYLFGFVFSSIDGGWAYTFGLAMIFATIMLVGSYLLLVESTRFLYLKGKISQAKESMDWILTPAAAERAFNEMGLSPPPSLSCLSHLLSSSQMIKMFQSAKHRLLTQVATPLTRNPFLLPLAFQTINPPTLLLQSTPNDSVLLSSLVWVWCSFNRSQDSPLSCITLLPSSKMLA